MMFSTTLKVYPRLKKVAKFGLTGLVFSSFFQYAFGETNTGSRIELEGSIGGSYIANQDFDGSFSLDNTVALRFSDYSIRGGLLYLDEMRPEDVSQSEDTYIESGGLYLGVNKRFALKPFDIEIGGGIIGTRSRVYLYDRKIDEDEAFSPYINVKAIKMLNKVFGFQAEWKYLDDVNGGNINVLQAGVRLSFGV